MSSAPLFAGNDVLLGAVTIPGTLDTSTSAPTNTATIYTASGSGAKIQQIRLTQIGTITATTVVNIFLYDGTNYHLLEPILLQSQTVDPTHVFPPIDFYYVNLSLPAGWSLRCTVTISGSVSTCKVLAFGGTF